MNDVDPTVSSRPATPLDDAEKSVPLSPSPRAVSPPLPAGREDVNKVEQPASPKAESEADTIIQSGRESSSPEKKRKFTAQHDNQTATNEEVKKRRLTPDDRRSPTKSPPPPPPPPPYSPSLHNHANDESEQHSDASDEDGHDHDHDHDEEEDEPRDRIPSSKKKHHVAVETSRSVSPGQLRHKRTTSHPPSSRKKHPILPRHSSEDRQSISSSASGSPLPSARLRRLATADNAAAPSPVKQHHPMAHKKQRDQNGRTRLARACAAQELETAIARHADNPEDLNIPDNAGNTPLQIASLEGCADIVKFLIDAGCEVNTKNIDRDTPLIDAVENGHLDVVKILLDAGANPRIVNAEGDEPYELVPLDTEGYDEIRRVIGQAKSHPPKSKQRSEDSHQDSSSRRTSDNSPRETPPPSYGIRSPPAAAAAAAAAAYTTKRKTVRSEATRNDLLWTKATPENLREFAARGDIAGVANILNVGQRADPESSIAAAKGGHDEVLSLLLGMGDAEADPDPVKGSVQKAGYNTPMLAAIGRGNLEVIKLLLSQPRFNPTRRLYYDRTYYELSRDRKGEDWEVEHDLLKDAYDNYTKAKKMRKAEAPDPSPVRRPRDSKEKPIAAVTSSSTKRLKSSPSPTGQKLPRKVVNVRRRDVVPPSSKDAVAAATGIKVVKKHRDGVMYSSKDHRPSAPIRSHSSSKEVSPEMSHRVDSSPRRKMRDAEGKSSSIIPRTEDHIRKRRLGVGIARPTQGNNERRRSSLFSSDSALSRDDRSHASDRVSDGKARQRKRSRDSESPPPERIRERERDSSEQQQQQQQLLHKKKRRHLTDGHADLPVNGNDGVDDLFEERAHNNNNNNNRDRGNSLPRSEKTVKEERERHDTQHDLDEIPAEDPSKRAEHEAEEQRERQEAERAAVEAGEKQKEKEEEEEEARRRAEVAAAEEEEAKERERQWQRQEEEEAAEAAAAAAAAAAEKAARHAQEKAEEAERKRKEAELRRVKQAEDERQKRLDQERMRFERQRREHEEQEQRRRNALPDRLRIAANLVGTSDPRARSHAWLKKFMPLVTAQTRQLDPMSRNNAEVIDEKWVPNYLVAPLLATNDLQLRQCKYIW